MWRRVADLALEQHKLLVAQRCFAAINDVARVNLLHVSFYVPGDLVRAHRYKNNIATAA